MNKKKKKRFGLNYFVCIMLGIFSMVMVVIVNWRGFQTQTGQRLDNILSEMEMYYDNYAASRDRLTHFEGMINQFFAEYLSDFEGSVTQEKIDSFSQYFPEKDIYYVGQNGQIVSNDTAKPLEDPEAVIEGINSNGFAVVNDDVYAGAATEKGYLIISDDFTISDELKNLFTVPNSTDDTVCFDLKTQQMIMASQSKLQGISWNKFLDSSARFVKTPSINGELAIGYNQTIGYFEYKQKQLDEDILLIAYADPIRIFKDFLRSIAMQIVMIPLVILILVGYTRKLNEAKNLPDLKRKKRNKGKLHLNRNVTRPLGAMFSISMILAVSLTGYLQLLSALSDQNVSALNTLNGLQNRITQSVQMSRRFADYHASNVKDLLELITWGIEQNPEKQMSQEKLQWIASSLELENVTVYDGNGVIVASTDGNLGDQLNDDPASSDAPCQNILLGNSEYAMQTLPDELEYYARARRDAPGFVRMTYMTDLKKELMSLDNFDTAFISCDFGDATKLYADLDDPSVIYYMNPITMQIDRLSFTLPEQLRGDRFNGIMNMEGRFLYVNTLRMENKIFIHAVMLRNILIPCLLSILNEFILFTVVFLILVYSTALYSEPVYHKAQSQMDEVSDFTEKYHDHVDEVHHATYRYFKDIKERLLEKTFKSTVDLLIRVSFASVMIIFVVDAFVSDSSLYAYLLSNTWTSGLNLFSLTKIIITMAVVWVLSTFLNHLILLISGNLNTRGATIGHMLSSIIQFGSIVFVIIYTLVQCGVSMSSLLAGAGLTGAALAIAGQSVVNDLLSGLFIVFEGKFGVGDWVTIEDWRGQVLEIGVRTTTVGIGDDIKIFNNSKLGGIIVWSHGMSGAICDVNIAYAEDVDAVIKLIYENKERYKRVIPHMSEGPVVQGVTELGDNGVTLRITAYVEDQKYAGQVKRAILKETKKIFDENGITIPFPQVVLHTGE